MRFFGTTDGKILVESDDRTEVGSAGLRFVMPSGALLESAGVFGLLAKSGALEGVYRFTTDSDREDLIYTAPELVGDTLHLYRCMWANTQFGSDPPRTADKVLHARLVPIEPPSPRFGRDAAAAVQEFLRPRPATTEAAVMAGRLTSPDSLPEVPGSGALDFVLEVDDNYDMVLKAAGKDLWRESVINSGEKRPRELEAIVRKRYGSRVRSFVSKVEYGD